MGLSINKPFARFHKSCFRKDLQVQNACTSFCNMLSQKYLGLASFEFRAKSQMRFRSVSQHYFASFRNLWFRKVSQGFANGLSQGLASAKIMVFRKDSQWAGSCVFGSECEIASDNFNNYTVYT